MSNYQVQNFNFKSVFKNFKHMINSIVPIKWDLVELICVTYKWAWVGPDDELKSYPFLVHFSDLFLSKKD